MENRRQHYRHEFAPTRRMIVRLRAAAGAPEVEADLIDLSVGGMCVYASALRTDTNVKWLATLALEGEPALLTIAAERVHERGGDRACCGFRFLSAVDAETAEEQERSIWRFLLGEQRRRRRFMQGG